MSVARDTVFDVKGKGVFLTGGAQGLGKAITEALLAKGARLVFCDLNEAIGKATESQLRSQYSADNITFLPSDVTDAQQHKAVWQQAVAILDRVDICVNNAGMMNESLWESCLAVNLVANIRGSLLAYEHMRKDRGGNGGVILNVASTAALHHDMHMCPVYSATKHGVLAYTLSMASDPNMASRDVRWTVLCPGAIETALITDAKDGHTSLSRDEWNAITRAIEYMMPEDAAAGAMVLLEDENSSGHVMKVEKEKGKIIRQVLCNDTSLPAVVAILAEKSRSEAEPVPVHL